MNTFVPKGNLIGPIVPEFILKMAMPSGAKLLYAVLCRHSNDKDHCWPSLDSLARRLGCSINSIKRYLRSLSNAGLILVRQGNHRSSTYYMLKPSYELIHNDNFGGSSELAAGEIAYPSNLASQQPKMDRKQSNLAPLKDLKKEIKENNPPLNQLQENAKNRVPNKSRKGGVDFSFADFEKVFEAYPRKESRGTARAAWRSLFSAGLLPPVSVILEAIERFKAGANWQRENGRFIPYLANFLKGERWNDPLTPDEAEAKQKSESAKQIRQLQAQKEEEQRKARAAKKAKLKPLFDEFAAKFKEPFHLPMVLGIWLSKFDKGFAPLASDVPETNTLGIFEFIKKFELDKKYPPQTSDSAKDKFPSDSSFRSENKIADTRKPDNQPSGSPTEKIQSVQSITGQVMDKLLMQRSRESMVGSSPQVCMVA